MNAIGRFRGRVDEVNIYFDFLRDILRPGAAIEYSNLDSTGSQQLSRNLVEHDVQRILKANAFLILYNLVEATIKQAIIEIYDAIAADGLKYKQLRHELRHLWISNRHGSRAVNKNVLERVRLLVDDVVNDVDIVMDPGAIPIAGNIDAAKVRELADSYGFRKGVRSEAKGGEKLLSVKTFRNSLAHGHVSFVECGRDLGFDQLSAIREQVILYLEDVLRNVQDYINHKHYRIGA